MKHLNLLAFFLMSVFYTSYGQSQTTSPKDSLRYQPKDSARHQSTDSVRHLPTDSVRHQSTDSVRHLPTDSIRHLPTDSVRHQPTDSKRYERKDSVKHDSKKPIISRIPDSMVRNVKQARNGNILVASYRGVFRYDGKSFTNLTGEISSPSFWDVLEDRKGNLWFATRDSGVYYYNGKSFEHFTTKEGLADNGVRSIYQDKAGIIWFGTGAGLSRYDGKSFRNFTTNDGLANDDITNILEDKTGKFWIGNRGSLSVYNGKTFSNPINKDGKPFNNVWSIIEDRKGNIWFGAQIVEDKKGSTVFTSNSLWRYDGHTFTRVSQKGAYAIIQDKKGNIWTTGATDPPAGTAVPPIGQFWSVSRYDQKSLYDKNPSVTEIRSSGEQAFCGILEANDGSIWFGSLGRGSGVYRYDGNNVTDFRQ